MGFCLGLCLSQSLQNLVRCGGRVYPDTDCVVYGYDDKVGIGQGMADTACSICGIAGAGLQELPVYRRDIDHSGILAVNHVIIELYAGSLVIYKFLHELTALAEVHDLVDLAFQ